MKIHEYQARELLLRCGVPVPPAICVETPDDAADAFKQLTTLYQCEQAVLKAQVHTGGRGKAGGVRMVRNARQAAEAATDMLAKPLVTHQTGPDGIRVRKLLISAAVSIARECYLAITIDRDNDCPVMIASSRGGMDIEQVAREQPDAMTRIPIDPVAGLHPYQCRIIARQLELTPKTALQFVDIMTRMATLFNETDAALIEINPLVLTEPDNDHPDGQLLAIDAKMTFDDNALYRHPKIKDLHDIEDENPDELHAKEFGLSYIRLHGDIGCLVNGAGLAMATMDIIKLHGGEPANFLDVGGSASEEAVTEAFRIILADQKVKGVLVNIFGGIAHCDTIAQAIINAAGQIGFNVPLVVRLEGTNVQTANSMLENAKDDLPTMITATDLTDAASKITTAIH